MFCLFSFLKWFFKRLSTDKSCYSDSIQRNYYNLLEFLHIQKQNINYFQTNKFLLKPEVFMSAFVEKASSISSSYRYYLETLTCKFFSGFDFCAKEEKTTNNEHLLYFNSRADQNLFVWSLQKLYRIHHQTLWTFYCYC